MYRRSNGTDRQMPSLEYALVSQLVYIYIYCVGTVTHGCQLLAPRVQRTVHVNKASEEKLYVPYRIAYDLYSRCTLLVHYSIYSTVLVYLILTDVRAPQQSIYVVYASTYISRVYIQYRYGIR